MAYELKIPSVGESITSATIGEWHQANGAYVKAGDEILTIETDKVSQALEAEVSGVLQHLAAEGDEVEIGAVVASIDEDAEAPAGSEGEGETAKKSAAAESTKGKGAGGKETATASAGERETAGFEGKATSVATKIAADRGVDLREVRGTGPGNRITKSDVLSATESPPARESATESPRSKKDRTTRRKMSPLRRKIANHLVNAQHEAAILTTFNECDMSSVMSVRKRVQEKFVDRHGLKLGFMSFFLKAVVEALREVPGINARIDGDEIVENHFFDIGVAVGTDKGLVVPVIRDVDEKSFAEIEEEIARYAAKARDGKIELHDLQGGVFTVTNGGIYGSLLSTPILNPPQSGILGMHTIQERPVAVEGEVVIRPMMYLALSYDHRIVDGKEAVTFLVKIKQCIEQPEAMLMGL